MQFSKPGLGGAAECLRPDTGVDGWSALFWEARSRMIRVTGALSPILFRQYSGATVRLFLWPGNGLGEPVSL